MRVGEVGKVRGNKGGKVVQVMDDKIGKMRENKEGVSR